MQTKLKGLTRIKLLDFSLDAVGFKTNYVKRDMNEEFIIFKGIMRV